MAKFSVELAGSCVVSAPLDLAQASFMMNRLVRLSGKIRLGPLVLTCTVRSSTALTSTIEASSDLTWAVGPLARCSENATSLAVSAAPSWNLTPGRSLNSQTVGSAVIFHEVASMGTSLPLASRPTRVSYIWCSSTKLVPVLNEWGSSVVGSEARAQRTVSA
ncbi:hypothetical protein D3C71_1550870 [compost metagenome]